MDKGLTLPNRAFDPYTPAEVKALDDLQPRALVMLLYGGAIDLIHAAQITPYLLAHAPRLLLRPYAGNIPQWKPALWARECHDRITRLHLAGDCVPANEMNLVGEGGSEDWASQIAWLKSFAQEWRTWTDRRLHLPALSPSGNWLAGYAAYRAAALARHFDAIDVHAYGDPRAIWQVGAQAGGTGQEVHLTEWNQMDPTAALTVAQQAGYTSACYFLLGGTPDQAQYDVLKQPAEYAAFAAWQEQPVADYTSPNHDGPRAQTRGIVLHATLSTKPLTVQQEYESTINYFNNPASQVSAHAVVGPNGQVTYPVPLNLIAWHCRASNQTHLGIEIAKPHLADAIAPEMLDTAAKIVAAWCQIYQIPLVWSTSHGLAEHHEMPTNTDGHSDIGGPFDRADFLARVQHHMEATPLTPSQKTALLDHLNILWGETQAATLAANPAESERACHERIVAIKVLLGLNG